MSWTAPPTYTTGMLITAAIANAQWGANLLLLATSIETSTGRISGEIKNYSQEIVTLTPSAGVLTVPLASGNNFKVTMAANITSIVVTGWVASKNNFFKIRFLQNGTGGFTVTLPNAGSSPPWLWAGNSVPTVTAGANKSTTVTADSDDGGATVFPALYTINA